MCHRGWHSGGSSCCLGKRQAAAPANATTTITAAINLRAARRSARSATIARLRSNPPKFSKSLDPLEGFPRRVARTSQLATADDAPPVARFKRLRSTMTGRVKAQSLADENSSSRRGCTCVRQLVVLVEATVDVEPHAESFRPVPKTVRRSNRGASRYLLHNLIDGVIKTDHCDTRGFAGRSR